MFRLEVRLLGMLNQAAIDHAQELVLRERVASVEVSGGDQEFDLDRGADLFAHFAVESLLVTLTLVDASGNAFPGAAFEIAVDRRVAVANICV